MQYKYTEADPTKEIEPTKPVRSFDLDPRRVSQIDPNWKAYDCYELSKDIVQVWYWQYRCVGVN